MKISALLVLLGLVVLSLPSFSQETGASNTSASAPLPNFFRYERLGGTVSQTGNGVTIRARLQFQSPDKLRIDIEPNAAALVPAQTVVASGAETRLYDTSTKRIQRLPYNVAKEPWRNRDLQSGGAANILLFNFSSIVEPYRTVLKTEANQTSMVFQADPKNGRFLAREYARFGGTAESSFYAAFKTVRFDRPESIELGINGDTLRSLTFRDTPQSAPEQYRLAHNEDGHLLTATRTGIIEESWIYDLGPRAEPFAAETFEFPDAPGQIIEDLQLRPLSEYSGGDSNTLFNKGVVQAQHLESYAEALETWKMAGMLMPQAVAPPMARFDAAMLIRNADHGREALAELSALLGANHFEVATRRANLTAMQRDWSSAAAALNSARQAQPQNMGIALLRADLHRSRGEYSDAQNILLDILKNDLRQPETLVDAAETLADMSDEDAAQSILKTLPQDNQWQHLARALLNLSISGDATEPALQHPLALASLAIGYGYEKQTAKAQVAWTKVAEVAPPTLQATAQAHLMTLHAVEGATPASLAAYRELVQLSSSEMPRQQARDTFLEAWRKNFRQSELKTALQQRALAMTATESDAQLWLAYQDLYGSEEEVTAALKAGLARFGQSAWWQSRWANQLTAMISPEGVSPAAVAARERLIGEALAALDKVIAVEPQQPFYPVQRALILTQRANRRTGVVDAARSVAQRNAANQSLDALAAKWAGDPDVALSIALQRLSLEPATRYEPIVAQLLQALHSGAPGRDGAERHLFVTAARQALASAYRQMNRPAEAVAQYEILLSAAFDPSEQSGIAVNYLNLLSQQEDAATITRLVTRLAREPWEYSEWQEMMVAVLSSLAPRRPLSSQVAAQLRASDDPYAHLAAAQLGNYLAQIAANEAARPDAPVGADNALAMATRDWNTAVNLLTAHTTGNDQLLAGRAAAALAETLLNQSIGALQDDEAGRIEEFLNIALDTEPNDANLRDVLAQVLAASNQKEKALATRDDLVRALPPTPENLRRAAALSTQIGDTPTAVTLARRAVDIAQVTPEDSPAALQQAAFALGRALLADNKTMPAMEIYFQLASPQWQLEDRAAALVDLQNRLRAMGQSTQAEAINQRLQALNLTPQQIEAAGQYATSF